MVVLVFCARRALVLVVREDCAVVTVDAVVVSVGVPGGNNELMSSVGDSVEGVCRRVLRRTATVLRDCGLPEEFGIGEAGLLLLLLSLLFLMLLLLLLLLLYFVLGAPQHGTIRRHHVSFFQANDIGAHE